MINNVEYTISHASVADAENIITYLNEVAGKTDNLTFGKNECPHSFIKERMIIKELYTNNSGIILLAKNLQGDIIGISSSISQGKRSSHVFSLDLTVKKKYWRNKIGENLMRNIIIESQKFNCRKTKSLYMYLVLIFLLFHSIKN